MTAARRRIVMLAGPTLLGMCACAPRAADLEGGAVRDLYGFFLVVAAGVFVVVVGLIAWSLFRYRERPGDTDMPEQFHTNIRLELVWFAIPQVIVVALFLLSLDTLDAVDESSAPVPLTVRVQGFQWGWRFSYENEDVTLTSEPEESAELVLPVQRRLLFEITASDVIHSFYVPRFLVKRDAIPGRINKLYVTLEETGTYRGVCAEFCGLLHHEMDFTVRAVTAEEFDTWLEEAAS